MSSPAPGSGGDGGPDWENLLYTLMYLFGTGIVGVLVEWIRRRLIPPPGSARRKPVDDAIAEELDYEYEQDRDITDGDPE